MAQEIDRRPWSDPAPGRPVPFREAWKDDLRAHVSPENYPPTRGGWVRIGLSILVQSAGLRVVTLYRLGHLLRHRGGLLGRLLASGLFWWSRHFYACAIASGARLHGGLILPHPQGIVIGPGAEVGPRAWIYQNVTIGGAPGKSGLPRVGADSRIFAGAVLAGPIVLGDHVIVGANAVVSRDVPDWSSVRCPPPIVGPRSSRPAVTAPAPDEAEGEGGEAGRVARP